MIDISLCIYRCLYDSIHIMFLTFGTLDTLVDSLQSKLQVKLHDNT